MSYSDVRVVSLTGEDPYGLGRAPSKGKTVLGRIEHSHRLSELLEAASFGNVVLLEDMIERARALELENETLCRTVAVLRAEHDRLEGLPQKCTEQRELLEQILRWLDVNAAGEYAGLLVSEVRAAVRDGGAAS